MVLIISVIYIAQMDKIVSIGFDCAGWRGKKNAFSALIFSNGKFNWKPPQTLEVPNDPGYFSYEKLCKELDLPRSNDKVLIAIDAPLGVPKDFIPFFKKPFNIGKPESGIENPVAYRYTDRHINRFSGKAPLSILDKMGINVTVALSHVAEWKKNGFKVIGPKSVQSKNQIIEVYPGTIRQTSHTIKTQIRNLLILLNDSSILDNYGYYLKEEGVKKSDKLDSALCAILGMSFLVNESRLPRLDKNIPLEFSRNSSYLKEGWIYHFPFEKLKTK